MPDLSPTIDARMLKLGTTWSNTVGDGVTATSVSTSGASFSSGINAIDLSLIHLKKCDTFKNVIPSKIFENAAMGKPIILGVEGEAKNIIEKYNLGLTFEPGNFNSFLTALEKSEFFNCKNREVFLEELSRNNQAKKMYHLLKKI